MRKFSKEELAHRDGKDGRQAYVAYGGKVYDVSDSLLWKGGDHQASHTAGQDLTDALEEAPHNSELLEEFPVVGILQED